MELVSLIKRIIPMEIIHFRRMLIINRNRRMPNCKYEKYLCKWYHKMTGFKMDFDNPTTFTQKQQWLKLYDQSSLKTVLCDKYAVRKYIEDTIGEKYLIPLIIVDGEDHFYDAFKIDFSKLPNQFVLKCNHGSQTNIIVRDKSSLSDRDIYKIKKQLNYWLKENYAYFQGLELQYRDVTPCIIIEKYMAINEELLDYKFLCFSGVMKYVWCDQGRFTNHRRSVYDLNYNIMPFKFHTYDSVIDNSAPENLEEMLEVAQKICGEYPYVRVDLYNIDGQVFFSELTFSSASGTELPRPLEYDLKLAPLIKIDKTRRERNMEYRRKRR